MTCTVCLRDASAGTGMRVICTANRGNATTLRSASLQPSRLVACVRSSNKEHVDQRNYSETIIIFWTNSFLFFFFLVFCFSVVVDCAAAHNVSSMYYYFFSFVVFAVWEAWGALFVDCGITSSTIYYWIFILGFSIDNNMCEYGFSLLFRSFFFAHTIYNFNSAAFKVYVWYMFCVRIFFFSIKYIFSLQRDSRGFFQYGL